MNFPRSTCCNCDYHVLLPRLDFQPAPGGGVRLLPGAGWKSSLCITQAKEKERRALMVIKTTITPYSYFLYYWLYYKCILYTISTPEKQDLKMPKLEVGNR